MRESEKHPTVGLLHSCDKLRALLIENPDLPMVVFADDTANDGDYRYMSCSSVSAEIGEILDCMQDVDDEKCFLDREDLEDAMRDQLEYDFDGSEKEFDQFIENRLEEYEPYWRKCIIVYVGNN